ncbi:MAG: tryptophan--tRNA ligase [Chloroherpetonaceae bacterium]|nr:tryptophan--tRNA ligase [Chthonomonadaceae bacterium]MDW8208207.1 tryptophan--tRNA ligase [Chloroherpetonaceae bacterium]
MSAPARKRLLSGMQPTGTGALHLGNLEGALRNWIRLQNDYEMYCCIVDWHALTTRFHEARAIAPASRQVAADYIASGLDPERCAIFLQSHVKEHAELHLLLSMITPLGWLERVPTFKEKRELMEARGEGDETVSYGLLGYPCLQAADILVYRAHLVPVGRDQAAHLEITREIARRFNRLYGEVFPVPEALIDEQTAIVPGVDGRKMSKSYDNAIYLCDPPDVVAEKVRNAFTTPTKIRKTDPGVPENCVVCQLRRIYDPEGYRISWEEDRAGARGCLQNKKELIDILNAFLDPIRRRREELLADPAELDRILLHGAERARAAAAETMQQVRAAMGF